MKTIICSLLLLAAMPGIASNANELNAKAPVTTHVTANAALTQGEVNQMTARLKEIREIAKGSLSSEEKASLKKEVLAIKQRLSDPVGGGVYISGGVLLLIVILLIIFL